ncbi:MAG: hypothetical protein HN919_06630 [Verrucomicrobia bacterium]|nr:hypothetical protein [Verrucomicrobiota bacterium]
MKLSGYRYYSLELGRWPSRDPINERGGANLYALLLNQPVSHVDPLGLVSYGHIPDGVFPVWYMTGDGGELYYPDGTDFNSRIRATQPSTEYEAQIHDSVLTSLIFNRQRCRSGGAYESSQTRNGQELLWAPALEDYDLFIAMNRYWLSYESEWIIDECCDYEFTITFEGSDTYDFSTLAKFLLIGVPYAGTPFDIRWDWEITGSNQ